MRNSHVVVRQHMDVVVSSVVFRASARFACILLASRCAGCGPAAAGRRGSGARCLWKSVVLRTPLLSAVVRVAAWTWLRIHCARSAAVRGRASRHETHERQYTVFSR